MVDKLLRFGHWFGEAFVQMLRQHPVELLLAVYGCVGCMVVFEVESSSEILDSALALVPLFIVLALAVNLLAGRGPWRKVYWVCWLPLIPLSLWSGLPDWIESLPFRITLGVLSPLALLVACRAADNRRFVNDAMAWLWAWMLAVFFPNIVLGLFCAILYSTAYIFNIHGDWVGHTALYAVILCQTLGVPVVLMMMFDRWQGRELRGNKVANVLLSYILTPAVLIYLVILYLYILKIVFTWSLPRGGVAYMVFGFMIFALVVKALQELLDRRLFDRFFNRFSLFALPPTALFWIGVMHRIGEYGLTEGRVWLVVCGGVMTICLGLFLARRTGRYLYVALAAFVVFASVAYVPALNPARIALRSQSSRAVRMAERLNLLDGQGRLVLPHLTDADSVNRRGYRALYDALQYVDGSDTTLFNRLGIESLSAFRTALPDSFYSYVVDGKSYSADDNRDQECIYIYSRKSCPISIEGYKVLYLNFCCWSDEDSPSYVFENDSLCFNLCNGQPQIVLSGRELLETQFRRVGAKDDQIYNKELLNASAKEFLTYSNKELTILFSGISFRVDSLPQLQRVEVAAVLLR